MVGSVVWSQIGGGNSNAASLQKHNGTITINVDGRTVTLYEGEEFMLP